MTRWEWHCQDCGTVIIRNNADDVSAWKARHLERCKQRKWEQAVHEAVESAPGDPDPPFEDEFRAATEADDRWRR